MVWKQDLANLKREMKASGEPESAPKPVPRRVEPVVERPMEDEDALFLSSMGGKRLASSADSPLAALVAPVGGPRSRPPEDEVDFLQAMGGVKSLRPPLADARPPVPSPVPAPTPDLFPEPSPIMNMQPLSPPEEPLPSKNPAPPPLERHPAGPELIQLAAGMAIEVDGLLDLRGHSLVDARDRLKESVLDGYHLGWRTLHVLLGPSEVLKQGFLAFLVSPGAATVSRYGQAPIPMGGPNAYILYYHAPLGATPRAPEVP